MSSIIVRHQELLDDIRRCRVCETELALGTNPVVQSHPDARVLIIGQAPGSKVHASGIPWDDPSGNRLRQWMGLDKESFYDAKKVAIMPMGFCYPGKGKSGDLPPRKECAPLWHQPLLQQLPNIAFTLLIGQYAQTHYLKAHQPKRLTSLTERVESWQAFIPTQLPLPHPSPRNRHWLAKNPWFEKEVVPWLQDHLRELFSRK